MLSARPLFLDAELFGVAVSDGGGQSAKRPVRKMPPELGSEALDSAFFGGMGAASTNPRE